MLFVAVVQSCGNMSVTQNLAWVVTEKLDAANKDAQAHQARINEDKQKARPLETQIPSIKVGPYQTFASTVVDKYIMQCSGLESLQMQRTATIVHQTVTRCHSYSPNNELCNAAYDLLWRYGSFCMGVSQTLTSVLYAGRDVCCGEAV